ncbi:MAG TPA: hypothetical protein VJ203_08575 [Bacteroidales bacterium]|nr:hypothetical protein [Bacteroidales bacterium]
MSQSILKFCVITAIVLAGTVRSNCQSDLPEVFKEETISEQLKYLEEHTRIYENYRAIREDMFRIISRNTNDTLKNAKTRINGLILHTAALDSRIDSLKNSLEVTQTELTEMTSTKNSISVLGLEVNKVAYNSFMWTIMAVLVFLLAVGFLSFKQNRAVTLRTKKDLNKLKEEFEEYQKKTRIERERMSIDHFNEIKKLKGG